MNLRRRKTDAGVNILCLGIPRAQPLDLLAGSLLKMFPLYICHIAHSNPTNHILREYLTSLQFCCEIANIFAIYCIKLQGEPRANYLKTLLPRAFFSVMKYSDLN